MDRILGQSRAIAMLQNALQSGRFHHAWIFSGPKGVGKFTTALELARILLDPEAQPNLAGVIDSDRSSASSQLIAAGTHPDLHVVRKELAIYSDSRELRERKQLNIPLDLLRERVIGGRVGDIYHDAPAYRTALRGHGKVFIIDEAELLDERGQNSMLKTLEEPPPQTYFFLVTSRPERLLNTIHSRAQHVRFLRLDKAAMKEWFKGAALEADARTIAWVQQFAEGSPGIATLAVQYGFYQWQQTLEPMIRELLEGRFPVAMGETMADLVDTFALEWVKRNKKASKDAANKDGVRHLLSFLASHARRSLEKACTNGDDPAQWLRVIDLLRDAERHLDSNVNMKLLLEELVVQWCVETAEV